MPLTVMVLYCKFLQYQSDLSVKVFIICGFGACFRNLATAFSGPGTKRAQTVKAIPKSPLKEVKYTRPIKQLNSADLRKVLR